MTNPKDKKNDAPAKSTKENKKEAVDSVKEKANEAAAASKKFWAKLKPKLKVAYDEVSKQLAYQVNNEHSVTRRVSKKACETAKSTAKLAKEKFNKSMATKKNKSASADAKKPVKKKPTAAKKKAAKKKSADSK